MTKTMLIDAANPEEVRVCLLQNGKVEDFDFEYASRKPLRGNIYLARVTRVEPSLQAAFIEYGGNRHGFLAFSEIHPDYYQIPVSDRQAIKAFARSTVFIDRPHGRMYYTILGMVRLKALAVPEPSVPRAPPMVHC